MTMLASAFVRRHAVKLVASVAIACGLVYSIHKGGLKLVPEGGDFHALRWWAPPLYVGLCVAVTWYRSIRWRFLLRSVAEVPKRRLFAVSIMGFTAILLLPFRIGEIARPYLIRTRKEDTRPGERPITITTATSSIVAERVIDGLYLSIVLALALALVPTIHPLPERVGAIPISVHQVRMYGYGILGLFCVLFAIIAIFYFARSWAHRTTLRVVGMVSRGVAERLAAVFEKLADGLHIFGRGPDAQGFFVETTLYWGLTAVGLWLLAWGCGVVHADGSPGTFGEACGLMGMLGCSIMLPGPPGLLGTFQAGLYAGMAMYYPTAIVTGAGAAFVFLTYALQVITQLALTVWALYGLGGGGGGILGGLRALEEAEGMSPNDGAAK
jgi:hypothetical protein